MTQLHHSSAYTRRIQYPHTEIVGSVMSMVTKSLMGQWSCGSQRPGYCSTSSRPWHRPHDTCLAGMQNVRFISSRLLPHTFQREAKKIKNYNIGYSTGSCMKLWRYAIGCIHWSPPRKMEIFKNMKQLQRRTLRSKSNGIRLEDSKALGWVSLGLQRHIMPQVWLQELMFGFCSCF